MVVVNADVVPGTPGQKPDDTDSGFSLDEVFADMREPVEGAEEGAPAGEIVTGEEEGADAGGSPAEKEAEGEEEGGEREEPSPAFNIADVLNPDGTLKVPVGTYRTVADVLKAVQEQATVIGRQGQELHELRTASRERQGVELLDMMENDPEKVEELLKRRKMKAESEQLARDAEFVRDPVGSAERIVERKLAERAERDAYVRSVAASFDAQNPGEFEALAPTREILKVELYGGVHPQTGKPVKPCIGELEALHLMALGRNVVNTRLKPKERKTSEGAPSARPAAAGAGIQPRSPKGEFAPKVATPEQSFARHMETTLPGREPWD